MKNEKERIKKLIVIRNFLFFLGGSYLLYLLFMRFSVEPFKKPEEYLISSVISNPSFYLDFGHMAHYKDGIVIFKGSKENTYAIVVVGNPFPKIKSKDDLRDDQLLVLKTSLEDYKKVQIGNIVTACGFLKKAEKENKQVYYVDTETVMIMGNKIIEDPNFEKLIEIVNKKIKDDLNRSWVHWTFGVLIPAGALLNH